MYLHQNLKLFKEAIEKTSSYFGLNSLLIEKDYYISSILNCITKLNDNFIFAGDNSLAKCYHLVNRYNNYLNLYFIQDLSSEESHKRFAKMNIINAADTLNLKVNGVQHLRPSGLHNRYKIPYSTVLNSKIKHHSFTVIPDSLTYEIEYNTILSSSFISDFFFAIGYNEIIKEYSLEPFQVKVQTHARAFVNKVFDLCDVFLGNKINGKSLFLYDIYKLFPFIIPNGELCDLIDEIKEIRQKDPINYSAEDDISIDDLLEIIIDTNYFKDDFENIAKHLIPESIDYITVLDTLVKIKNSKVFY